MKGFVDGFPGIGGWRAEIPEETEGLTEQVSVENTGSLIGVVFTDDIANDVTGRLSVGAGAGGLDEVFLRGQGRLGGGWWSILG